MDIAAGRDVTITGSDVLSRDGIGIIGQNVTIQAAEDSTSVTETQKFKQTGINVSLKGGAVDTALAVKNSVERASEAKDDRLSALHAAKAGQTLFSSGGAGLSSLKGMGDQIGQAKADVANEKQTAGGLSLRVGIGASKSSSSTEYTATTSSGSRIASEGDVVIQATGDGQGNGGDLKIIGSKVEGDNVALAAANDLILKSQQETRQQIERNKSSSGEIGITIGSEAGFGVYVAASAAKGKGDGSGTTHAETTIDAANTLTMISGRDMTLEGAQARGNTVIANVGRDLTLISQQDSNDYKRKDVSAGVDVAVGTGGASVSANYNQSKIDSTYTSVKEQTGIQAGEGGFDINVGGHTQLTGAAIASMAEPSRNHLSTGSLSVEDLKNEAAYKASSVGLSVSGSTSGGMNAPAPSVGIPQSEKASSVTRGDIAAGTVEVRNGDTTALDGLSRDTTVLQQDGLKEIFDQQNVQERLEMGQVASEVGFRAAGDIAKALTNGYTEAEMQAKAAQKLLDGAGSDAERQAAQEMLDKANASMSANKGQYDLWKDGGTGKTVLHAVTGALVAAAGGGNVLQGALGAGAAELGRPLTSDESKLVQQLVSAGIGMVAGGGTGAVTGLAGEQFNRQLHPDERKVIEKLMAEGYSEERLMAVACVMVQCLLGRNMIEPGTLLDGADGMSLTPAGVYLAAQYQSILDGMTAGEQAEVTRLLTGSGLFKYTSTDAYTDAFHDVQVAQRLGGVGQASIGMLGAWASSALCSFTGLGCVAAAESADNIAAGLTTWYQGRPTLTLQNRALQAAGLSPENANLVEALTGVGIAAGGAVATNRALAAQGKAAGATGNGGSSSGSGGRTETPNQLLPDYISGDGLALRTPIDAMSDLRQGRLPGNSIGGLGTPREMPPYSNSNEAAEQFALQFFGGKMPAEAKQIGGGAWTAKALDGTYVTFRPAGVASGKTKSTTASVDVNSEWVKAMNGGIQLKLKFPRHGETGAGGTP